MYNKTYNSKYLLNIHQLFANAKTRSYQLLNPRNNDIIADVGCGTGIDAMHFAQSGARVYGLNHDKSFIEEASKNKNSDSKINFVCCQAQKIPLQDGFVDKIRYDRIFQHVQNHNEVITEAKRVLKPGGTLQIIDTDYFSLSLFLPGLTLERKIIKFCCDRFCGAPEIRFLPEKLRNQGFYDISMEVYNYIINDFETANYIIRFDKIIYEEFHKGNITQNEILIWEEQKKGDFSFSLNLLILQAFKEN